MSQFIIDDRIFEIYSGVFIGVIIAKGVDNSVETPFDVTQELQKEEQRIHDAFWNIQLSELPQISAWREAYRTFGAKPKQYKSSIESLYRRIVKGKFIGSINPLVDMYNLVSLKYMLPVGGEDLDTIQGDIMLTFAGDDEPPVKLLGDPDVRSPKEGEVIYKDEVSAICRRWNWREADRTKLTERTRNCVLVVEGLPPATREHIFLAIEKLKDSVVRYCGGDVSSVLLDRGNCVIDNL